MGAATILKQQIRVARRLWGNEAQPELDHFEQAIERANQEWNRRQEQPRAVSFARRVRPQKPEEKEAR